MPALFRNAVLPRFAPNGDMWLILRGEGQLERYDSAGLLQVSVALEAPEMERTWALCVEKAKETLRDQRRMTGLSYVFDAVVLDQTLWILMNTPDDAPAVILAVAPDGKVMQRVLFSNVLGAHNFAFDRGSGRVYFTRPSTASIVASSVPDTLFRL